MSNISAKLIADSVTPYFNRKRLCTYELEYPRFIHSELMTHKMLSKNCASSRAIPIKKMNEIIRSNTAAPVYWGKNMAGMKAKEALSEYDTSLAIDIWEEARESAIGFSERLDACGSHKQITNRITEPFSMIKTVLSGTEFKNFFWLRDHADAQPEIRELARKMKLAEEDSEPVVLEKDQWHLPYITTKFVSKKPRYFAGDIEVDKETAIKISVSCCAQTSYRNLDTSVEKAVKIYDMLIGAEVKHMSPFEHIATPIKPCYPSPTDSDEWEDGITHMRRDGSYWSANFNGWIQYRQLFTHESVKG